MNENVIVKINKPLINDSCNLFICTIHDFSSLIIILQVRKERLKWASNSTAENVFVG